MDQAVEFRKKRVQESRTRGAENLRRRRDAAWAKGASAPQFMTLGEKKKGLSFISNRQRRKERTFCASGLAGIEPTPPAPEEQGMRVGECYIVYDIDPDIL